MDEDVADGAVLVPHPGRVVTQRPAAPQAREDAVDHRPVDVKLGDVASDVFLARIAQHVELGAIGAQDDAVRPDPVQADRRGFEEVGELLLAAAKALGGLAPIGFGPQPLQAGHDLVRDGQCGLELVGGEGVRRIEIDHELADEAGIAHQRHEGQRTDAFGFDRARERLGQSGGSKIVDAERLRIALPRRPGRMAFDGLPVTGREPLPGDEAHDTGSVEEQHRGTVAVERLADRGERGSMDLVDARGVLQPVGQPIQRAHAPGAARERLFGALALGDVDAGGLGLEQAATGVEFEPPVGPQRPALAGGGVEAVLDPDFGCSRCEALERGAHRGPIVLADEVPEAAPDHALGARSARPRIGGVDEDDGAVGPEAADHLGLSVEAGLLVGAGARHGGDGVACHGSGASVPQPAAWTERTQGHGAEQGGRFVHGRSRGGMRICRTWYHRVRAGPPPAGSLQGAMQASIPRPATRRRSARSAGNGLHGAETIWAPDRCR